MRTDFSPAQLADPAMAASEAAIRTCVHCGFCTATCPTYVLLGDELDSPRGRIALMQDMLQNERSPQPEVVKHIDRCLSCLACTTTCPSGVDYMHLVDHARAYVAEHYRRPWHERLMRAVLAAVLPHPGRFRAALRLGRIARPLGPLFGRMARLRPLSAMLDLTPCALPASVPVRAAHVPSARGRVILQQGCAEPVLRPEIRAATLRLLNRAGYDVDFAPGEACCGALVHHLGQEAAGLASARRNVDAWTREIDAGLDAILITASGCGTMIKDYGFLLRNDPAYADKAATVSALAKDVSEFLDDVGLPETISPGLTVAYHAACSLQHGQKVTAPPARLLRAAGFTVKTPAEAHLCCGSAGTYNMLQPELSTQLRDRKLANLARLDADVIVTGNIGCATQLALGAGIPVLHLVELLDWATGGPVPAGLSASLSTSLPPEQPRSPS